MLELNVSLVGTRGSDRTVMYSIRTVPCRRFKYREEMTRTVQLVPNLLPTYKKPQTQRSQARYRYGGSDEPPT